MRVQKNVLFGILVTLLVLWAAANACAQILPPHGQGQIGLQAVVLCEQLTVRAERDAGSRAVTSLRFGDTVIVRQDWGGWAECFLSDSEDAAPAGWVNSDYIITDPAWYRTEEATAVYAWNDTAAPRVALLKAGTLLPILKMESAWVLVSLRGAAGWIRTEVPPTARFRQNCPVVLAELVTEKGRYTSRSCEELTWIKNAFAAAETAQADDCPFSAALTLTFSDGSTITVYPATDGCRVFRAENGACYTYGTARQIEAEQGFHGIRVSDSFWSIFGTAKEDPAH